MTDDEIKAAIKVCTAAIGKHEGPEDDAAFALISNFLINQQRMADALSEIAAAVQSDGYGYHAIRTSGV